MVGQQHTFGVTPSAFGGFGTNSSTGFGRFGTNTSSGAFGASTFGQSEFETPSTRSAGGLFGSFPPSGSRSASTFESGVSRTLETSSFGQPAFETLHAPPASGTSFGTENISKTSFFGHSIPAGGLFGSSQSTGFGVGGAANTQTSTLERSFGSSTNKSGIDNQSQTKPFGYDASSTSSSAGLFGTNNAGGTKLFSNTFEYQIPSSGRFSFGVPSTASGNAARLKVSLSVDTQDKKGKHVSDEKTATVKFVPFEAGLDTMARGGFTANVSTKICVITAMKEYKDTSIEELRLKDYLSEVKNSTSEQKQPHGFKFGSTKSDFPKTPGSLIWKPYEKSVGGPFGTNVSWSNAKPNFKTEYNKFLFSNNTSRNPCETQNAGLFDSKIREFKPLFGTTTPPWSSYGKQNAKNDNEPILDTATSWGQFGKQNVKGFGTNGNKSIFGTNNAPWNSSGNKKGCFSGYKACSKSYGSSAESKSKNVIVGPCTKTWHSYGNQNESFFIKPQDKRQFFGVSKTEGSSFEENHMSTSVEVMNNVTKKIAMMCNDLKEYMDSSANSLVLEMMRKKEERIKELEGTVKDLEVEKELLKNFTHPAQLYGGKAYMNARIVGCCSVAQRDIKDIQESIIRLRREMDDVKKILDKYEKGELENEMVVEDSRGFADVSMKTWGFRLPHQSAVCGEENLQEFKNSIKQLEEEMKLLKISADVLQEKSTKGAKRQKDSHGDNIMNCNLCSSVLETFNIAVKIDENIQENRNAETDLMAKKDFDKLCSEDNTFTKRCCEKPSSDQDRQEPYCRRHSSDEDQHTRCKWHSSNEDQKETCCKKLSFGDQNGTRSKDYFLDNGQQKLCCEKYSFDKNPQTTCCEKRSLLKDQQTSCQKRSSPDRDQQKTCSKHCSPNRTQLKANDNHSPGKDQQRPCIKDQSTDKDHQKSSSTYYSLDAKEQQPCCKKRSPDKDQQRSCTKDHSTNKDHQKSSSTYYSLDAKKQQPCCKKRSPDNDQQQLPCNKDHSTDKDQQKSSCRYHSFDAKEQQLRCENHSLDKDQQNFSCNDDENKSMVACRYCDQHSNLDPDALEGSQDNMDARESFLIFGKGGGLNDKWCDWYENEDDWP